MDIKPYDQQFRADGNINMLNFNINSPHFWDLESTVCKAYIYITVSTVSYYFISSQFFQDCKLDLASFITPFLLIEYEANS